MTKLLKHFIHFKLSFNDAELILNLSLLDF